MVRPIDEFRNFVENIGDRLRCMFCGFVFSAKTSISRFKLHLAGVEGRGVNICGQVPPDVKEKAYEAIQNPHKRRKTMPSSSYNRAANTLPTSSRQQTNEVETGVRGGEQETGAVRSPIGAELINGFETFSSAGLAWIHDALDAQNIQDENEVRDARMVGTEVQSAEQEMVEREEEESREMPQEYFMQLNETRVTGGSRNEVTYTVLTSSQEQTNEAEIEVKDVGMAQTEMGEGVEQENWNESMIDYSMQPVGGDLVGQAVSKPWDGIISFLMEDQTLRNDRDNVGVSLPTNESREMPQESFMQLPGGSRNEVTYTVPISSQEQTNEGEIEVRAVGMAQTEAISMKQEMGQGVEQENWNESMTDNSMQPIERGSSPKGPVVDAQVNIMANVQQTTDEDLVGQAVSKPWDGIISFLMEDQTLSNDRDDVGLSLPTKELVGHAFEEKKKEIWSRLMEDDVLSIGVWGMGGVGKTTLMRHIHNQLLERPNTFTRAYWVTASSDCSIYALQNLIAKTIGLNLSKGDDVWKRAMILHDELIKKQKFVLILDDLRDDFDVDEVGIPVRLNGCKLILATRWRGICWQMCVGKENVIKVEPLLEQEAWTLFKKELGNYETELEPLAKAVASECAGLPLGLKTMARSMRGVDDVRQWRNALVGLKEAKKRNNGMNQEVFPALELSYNHLKDPKLQECFLYCALFPKDFDIKRDDLIEYWIVEGIIKGTKCRQEEYDEGHCILNKLENACLLEGCTDGEDDRCVKMHDLIRDMAVQKLREKSVMVEAGRQLKELPEVERWTKDLVRVSLMENYILEIPSSHSLRCPKLSTILLRSNWELSFIADSFFQQLHRLTVLDLSCTKIEKLPDSISELVSLIALLLKECRNLTHIPTLAKLKALKKLDLSFTEFLEEVPEGMELLSNLRYLNLGGSGVKELPTRIMPNFSHLQVLILTQFYDDCKEKIISIKGKEVACLRKLETLKCYFEHLFDFNEYMESQKETPSLYTYSFLIGKQNEFGFLKFIAYYIPNELSKKVWLSELSISRQEDFVAFPKDIEELVLMKCNVPRTLFVDFSLRCSTKLKYIHLWGCDGIKRLLSMSSSSPDILKSLETLLLSNLKDFGFIISKEEAALRPLSSNATFSCLKHCEIYSCHKVKRLFPFRMLSNLKNLEIIEVRRCDEMEEILIAEEEKNDNVNDDETEEEKEGHMGEKNSSSSDNLSIQFSLPKLRILVLRALPKLKSICRGVMICNSLREIIFVDCPKLKRIPFSFPLLSLQIIKAYPIEWWESVEWGHISEKNLLQPRVEFRKY